jgi:ribosomal protein S27AE
MNGFLFLVVVVAVIFFFSRVASKLSEAHQKNLRKKRRSCPKCGCSQENFVQVVHHTKSYSYTPTKVIRHYNADGEETGHSEIDGETVSKTYPEAYIMRRCPSCSHGWETPMRE